MPGNTNQSNHEQAMRAAITIAKQQPKAPFGAVLMDRRTGKMVARGANRSKENPAWHGEMDVINRHSAASIKPQWEHLTLYTTAEPCPMCMAAIAWAGISQVVYGTDIPTLQQQGWKQMELRASDVIAGANFREITLVGGVLQAECDRLFAFAQQARSQIITAETQSSEDDDF